MAYLIDTQSALNDFSASLVKAEQIGLDTEFIRNGTYYPILSLIQVMPQQNDITLIDVLSGIDLQPFIEAIGKQNKIIHDAKQDLEVMHSATGQSLTNIWDTKVAGLLIGYQEAPSYKTLCADFLDIHIEKAEQFSNWQQRPLREAQLQYAREDVEHLLNLHRVMSSIISDTGKEDWMKEEMQLLDNIRFLDTTITKQALKFAHYHFTEAKIRFLIVILEARLNTAKKLNRSINRVMHDKDIAMSLLGHKDSLKKLENIITWDQVLEGSSLDSVMQEAALIKRTMAKRNSVDKNLLSKAMLVLSDVANKHKVSQTFISNKSNIEMALHGIRTNNPIFTGWRHSIFGLHIEEMMEV